MDNRSKIEMLRQLNKAINDQLCTIIEDGGDWEPYENMPVYTIGIGGMTFNFPATLIYRVMFEYLFKGWDELKDDAAAGIEGASSKGEILEDAFNALGYVLDSDTFDDDTEDNI